MAYLYDNENQCGALLEMVLLLVETSPIWEFYNECRMLEAFVLRGLPLVASFFPCLDVLPQCLDNEKQRRTTPGVSVTLKPGMTVHVCNHIHSEAKAGGRGTNSRPAWYTARCQG